MDFSSVSLEPNFTAAQEWIEMGGREKVPADPPQRNQHLCMKSFFGLFNFVSLLIVQ